MLLVQTEWAYVTGGVVDKSVPDHLVLTLKSLATHSSRAALNGAEVGTVIGVHGRVGTGW